MNFIERIEKIQTRIILLITLLIFMCGIFVGGMLMSIILYNCCIK